MRIDFRAIALGALVLFVQQGAWSQQPGQVKFVTAADITALMHKQPPDRNSLGQTFLTDGPYKVNMEHRVAGAGGAVHEREAERFYVIDGAGTFVYGGKLVDEKRTNESNLSGTSISGGETRKVSKGDWFMVPAGVPHQVSAVDGPLTLMTLHLPRAGQ